MERCFQGAKCTALAMGDGPKAKEDAYTAARLLFSALFQPLRLRR